jgi:hypothetical protein
MPVVLPVGAVLCVEVVPVRRVAAYALPSVESVLLQYHEKSSRAHPGSFFFLL